jgi:hypothetical protein
MHYYCHTSFTLLTSGVIHTETENLFDEVICFAVTGSLTAGKKKSKFKETVNDLNSGYSGDPISSHNFSELKFYS